MARSYEHCLGLIADATGGAIDKAEAERILAEIEDHADRLRREGRAIRSDAELREFAAQAAERRQIEAMADRRSAVMQALAFEKGTASTRRLVASGVGRMDAFLARMSGLNTRATGIRDSAERAQSGYHGRYVGSLVAQLRKMPDAFRVLTDGDLFGTPSAENLALNRKIVREMEEPGSTGDKVARQVAELYSRFGELSRRDANALGAFIGKLKEGGWFPHSHDGDRLAKVDKATWVDFIYARLDHEATFGSRTEAEARERLGTIHDEIVLGIDPAEETRRASLGVPGAPSSLAKRMNEQRFLQFKDAESFSQYNDAYGRGTATAAMFEHLDAMARHNGLMQEFGPTPEYGLRSEAREIARDVARDPRLTTKQKQEAIKELGSIHDWPAWKALTGKLGASAGHKVLGVDLAKAARGVQNVQNITHLGATVLLSAVTDPAAMIANLHFQGRPLAEAFAQVLRGLVRGVPEGDRREFLDSVGVGFEGLLHHAVNRFAAEDEPIGGLTKASTALQRVQGMVGFVDREKSVQTDIMGAALGKLAGRGWDALPVRDRNVLDLHGFGPAEWDALRSAAHTGDSGRTYLHPDRIADIPDARIDALVQPRLDEAGRSVQARMRQLEAMDEREKGWVEKRVERLGDKIQAAGDRLAAFRNSLEGRRSARLEALDARMEVVQARAEAGRTLSEIVAARTGMGGREAVQEAVRGMAEGAAAAGKEAVERAAGAGERAGRTEGKAGATAADLRGRIDKLGKTTERRNAADAAALEKKVARQRGELAGKLDAADAKFLDAWDAREARVRARGEQAEAYARKQMKGVPIKPEDMARAREAMGRYAQTLDKHIGQLEAAKARVEARRTKAEGRQAEGEAAAGEALQARQEKRQTRAEDATALLSDRIDLALERASEAEARLRRQAERMGTRLEDTILGRGERTAARVGARFESGVRGAYGSGFGAGRRLAQAEARVRELEKAGGGLVEETDKRVAAEAKRVGDMLQRRDDEVREFIARMQERAQARAEERAALPERLANRVQSLRDGARRELDVAYRGMMRDELRFGVIEPDARTRKYTTGGLQAGTVWGTVARLFGQYKSFPIAFAQRVVGRQLHSQPGYGSAGATALHGTWHVGTTLAMMAVSGLMLQWVRDMVGGKSPTPVTLPDGSPNTQLWMQALQNSGALGVYSDALAAAAQSFMQGRPALGLSDLAGPSVSTLGDLVNLLHEAASSDPREHSKAASDTVRWIFGNIPGPATLHSFWLTRAAVDYLFLSSLYQFAKPGYIERQQQGAMKGRPTPFAEPLRPFG